MVLVLKLVFLRILLQHDVQGVSVDYADPNDFHLDKSGKLDYAMSYIDEYDATGQCPFGLKFKKDCNRCTCDPQDGQVMCTLIGCGPCVMGTNFTIECNTCLCDESTGVTKCSRKECNEGTFSKCVNGPVFMQDCNTCHCSLRTGHTTCTTKDCSSGQDANHELCPNGTYFKPDICNYCVCDPETGDTSCTLVYCGSEEEEEDELMKKQSPKDKNLKLKIKEAATNCKPPEVILVGSCRCDCRLPGVVVCRESCFKQNE